eukprot:GHVU01017665.1.p1 GENE.GHVU01017665.1~~GHVU01017665.1.p1  ORF type:complete len:203 (+),score=16.55 GHVU01017665.1:1124-1732(+)
MKSQRTDAAVATIVDSGSTATRTFSKEQIRFLEVTYAGPWKYWFLGASGRPGVTANNNSLERWNRAFKDENCQRGKRLSIPMLLTVKFPTALKYDSADKGSTKPLKRGSGIVTADMIRRAKRVHGLTTLYCHAGNVLYIDATPSEMQPITDTRMLSYILGVRGNIAEKVPWTELGPTYLHLAACTYHAPDTRVPPPATPCNI